MTLEHHNTRTPYFAGIGFLILAILAELFSILRLNDGILVYTLDDAYIHLALAENMLKGHYGVNLNEFSASSSSILWPFIIAPFSVFEYSPLVINIVFAVMTVIVYVNILQASVGVTHRTQNTTLITALTIALILGTNITGLIFTGMEHSLQLLCVSLIAYGLIIEVEKGILNRWFLIAILCAPLVRYECLAISLATICYLLLNKHYKAPIVLTIALATTLVAFSYFLQSQGASTLPTSVAAKSNLVESQAGITTVIKNLWSTPSHSIGLSLAIIVIGLLTFSLFSTTPKKSQLAFIGVISGLAHFVAGRYGWYHRYEIYILAFLFLVSFYLYGPFIKAKLEQSKPLLSVMKTSIVAFAFIMVVGQNYIYHLTTLPFASNNIYEQQYQMHRFVTEHYQKPVAVNDLGYVAYKNDNYVLDLVGLASIEAFKNYWKKENSSDWIEELTDKNNVELAMIYGAWFRKLPDEWIKIGELRLSGEKITAAKNTVDFYALNQTAYENIREQLHSFTKTLPSKVTFEFE